MKKVTLLLAVLLLITSLGFAGSKRKYRKENNETNLKTLSTKEDINKLEVKIAETKVEILRWTFGFFIALMLALIGLYFKK